MGAFRMLLRIIVFGVVGVLLACGSENTTSNKLIQSSSSSSIDELSSSSVVKTQSSSSENKFYTDCVDEINKYRATESKPPLNRWKEGEACIVNQLNADIISGASHSAMGDCGESAQNECPGYPSFESITSLCMKQMWDEGPGEPYEEHGHYINMSSLDYTTVACNYVLAPDGKYWAIMNFK